MRGRATFYGAIWCYTDNAYEGDNRVMGNSNWGQVDVWARWKPEGWATKNVYSPVQYKGEDSVALPGKNQDLLLPYENRYENVSFDDSDFEIYYSINGGEATRLTSSISPKESGDIAISAPKGGWKLGDKITLQFYKTTSGIRRNVVTNVVTIGTPVYTTPESSGKSPEITEDNEFIYVTGDEFQIAFSKETGMITSGTYKEETVLVGGPYLNLGMSDPGTWTLNTISSETKEDAAVITIDGNYSNSSVNGCTFILMIDSEGQINTSYEIKNTSNLSVYEVGVSYDLPQNADTLSWIRDGYLSYYPDDQLGRLEGTAVKEYDDWQREWGVEPTKPWKEDDKDFYNFGFDDEGGRGTNDFRGSKTGIYYAEMGLEDSSALLSVYGDGKDSSVRASINEDQTVRLAINSQWGYPLNSLAQVSPKVITVPTGYTEQITMQLSDTHNHYDLSYDAVPTAEFIKASSATAGSTYGVGATEAVNLINNSGMSSDLVLDAVHGNASNADGMWHSQENPGENAWIQVDLGRVYSLNQMWIWNHNQQNLTPRGLKNVKIEYSIDGKDWTALTTDLTFTDGDPEYPFQFAQADGNADLRATNLNDGNHTPVSFGGVSARYVKITANPVSGNGSWGATYYGLSELRFTAVADKDALQELYDQWKDVTEQGNYTDSTWNTFVNALSEAKDVLEDESATQVVVDEAYDHLSTAISRLISVDKSDLQTLYNECKDLEQGNYPSGSWNVFVEAREAAKAVLENGDATQEEVQEAFTALLTARLALSEVNKELLIYAIELGESMDTEGCTEESVKALREALAAGKEIRDKKDATEAEVTQAVKDIMEAMAGLEKKADKSELEKLYESASKLTEEKYTPGSFEKLKEALEQAKKVLEDENAEEKEIAEAFEKLLEAMTNLKNKGEKSGLETAIKMVEEVLSQKEKYEAESIEGMEELLKEAKEVEANEEASQQEIEEMVKALLEAISKAELKEEGGSSEGGDGSQGGTDSSDTDSSENTGSKDESSNGDSSIQTPEDPATGDNSWMLLVIAGMLGVFAAAVLLVSRKSRYN